MKKNLISLFILLGGFTVLDVAGQQAGSLDTTFGVGGKVLLNIPGGWNSIALQADGKIVFAGGSYLGRLNADGTLDSSFSNDGWDSLSILGLDDIHVQQDGKILASGGKIVRYLSDGSLDTTFGTSGIVYNYYGLRTGIQPDCKIIALCGGEFKVIRLDTNGIIDSSFGNAGVTDPIFFPLNYYDAYDLDMTVQQDGKIIVVGYIMECPNVCYTSPVLIRYDSSGTPEIIYWWGWTSYDWPMFNTVTVSDKGSIIVSRTEDYFNPFYKIETILNNGDYASAVITNYLSPHYIVAQPDGKVLTTGLLVNGQNDFCLMRIANGIDTSFGSNGLVTTDFGNINGEGSNSLAVQSDWKIIAIGYSGGQLALARYNNCGASYRSVMPCTSSCNGSISLSSQFGISPFTYIWSTGETTATIDSLCSGNYSLTITDSAGCYTNYNMILAPPDAHAYSTSSLCDSSCDGTARATLTNGTAPFSFLWSNGETTDTITGICSGIYSVLITDSNQCIDSALVTVTQPAALILTSSFIHNPTCAGCTDGYITFVYSGGTSPYQVIWSPSTGNLSGDSLLNLLAGIYTVTLTDANGCSSSFVDTLVDSPDKVLDPGSDENIFISPNPVSGKLTIHCKQDAVDLIEIFNSLGELKYSLDVKCLPKDFGSWTVDSGLLPEGIYLIKIVVGVKVFMRKVVKV